VATVLVLVLEVLFTWRVLLTAVWVAIPAK
jgi:hypothetical protein